GQLNVAHALAPHLRQCDFNDTLVADVTAETNALEFAAVTLPVLHRPENTLAEQAIAFRLERAVVNRLRLGDFAIRPAADLFRRSDLELDEVEVARARLPCAREIDHISLLLSSESY